MLKFIRIGALALCGMACGVDCTLIGCDSGLKIQFASAPSAPFRIDASSADAGTRSYSCGNNTGCITPSLTISDYVPENVTLIVTYEGRTTTTTVRPSYTESTPNGKGCGPTCPVATIALPLP